MRALLSLIVFVAVSAGVLLVSGVRSVEVASGMQAFDFGKLALAACVTGAIAAYTLFHWLAAMEKLRKVIFQRQELDTWLTYSLGPSETWKELATDRMPRDPLGSAVSSAIRRSGSSDPAAAVAERTLQMVQAHADKERRFANLAVYWGLAGTLLGLSMAVAALGGLSTDTELIRERILGIIGGFGSSFFAALSGVFATIVLGKTVAVYDAEVEAYAADIEAFLAEKVLPEHEERFGKHNSLEVALGRSIREAMSPILGEIVGARADLDRAITAAAESAMAARDACVEVRTSLQDVREAAAALLGTVRDLKPTIELMGKVILTLNDASENLKPFGQAAQKLNETYERLLPFYESVDIVALGLKHIGDFPARSEGLLRQMKDELLAHQQQVSLGQQAQGDALRLLAVEIGEQIQTLRNAVFDYSEVVRELPISVYSQRQATEHEGVFSRFEDRAQVAGSQVEASATAILQHEKRVLDLLSRLEIVSGEAQKTLGGLARTAHGTEQSMRQVEERLASPPWKRWRK
jgi:hypothetical protein